jgi:hypothetical protein
VIFLVDKNFTLPAALKADVNVALPWWAGAEKCHKNNFV